jgi:hypothetical protein
MSVLRPLVLGRSVSAKLLLSRWIVSIAVPARVNAEEGEPVELFPQVAAFVAARVAEFEQILAGRHASLREVADYVVRQR